MLACTHTLMHTYTHTYTLTNTHTHIHTYTHTQIHTYAHAYIMGARACIHAVDTTLQHTHTHIHLHVRHIHAHTHTHARTCTNTHIHTYTNTHMHKYTHTRIHTCTHTHMHTYTHAHIHTCTHTHIHTYTHTHMYACTHTHIHTYTHTHIHTIMAGDSELSRKQSVTVVEVTVGAGCNDKSRSAKGSSCDSSVSGGGRLRDCGALTFDLRLDKGCLAAHAARTGGTRGGGAQRGRARPPFVVAYPTFCHSLWTVNE